jgi:nucleotide-binding universal stress UspA family protein
MDTDVQVVHGRAAEALVEASADAELLVIGRHDPLVPIGSHVGPVARAVLREATCPVLLASPRPHRAVYHP